MNNLLRENRRFILFMVLMAVFRSGLADWNTVPTGSMRPTIVEGDRIWVNKVAYDVRLPFTSFSIYRKANPVRGDIVIFDSERAGKRLVKRVIGLPGDQVQLDNNRLTVNGIAASYQYAGSEGKTDRFVERLENVHHDVHFRKSLSPDAASRPGPVPYNSFPLLTVPADHYLVLGDNRDNSADSRVIGFVPRDEIIGRSTTVVMSIDYDRHYLPRPERFLHRMH